MGMRSPLVTVMHAWKMQWNTRKIAVMGSVLPICVGSPRTNRAIITHPATTEPMLKLRRAVRFPILMATWLPKIDTRMLGMNTIRPSLP